MDSKTYAEVIIELLRNPDLIKHFSKNCLHSFDNPISSSVESIWEEILVGVIQKKDRAKR